MSPLLSWETVEYEERHRSTDWYWAVILISLATIVVSIFFDNYLFAILIAIATGTIFLFAIRKPARITVELNTDAIKIGNEIVRFKNLKSFWIDEEEKKLFLESQRTLAPLIALSLENVPPHEIHEILARRLPEIEVREPLTHKISDYLGL